MDEEFSGQAYEELLGHTVDKIAVLDESGTITYVNAAVTRLLGYDPEDLVGESVFQYIHPDDRESVRETFQEVVTAAGDYTTGSVEFRFRGDDGSWVWLESRGSNQAAGAFDGYVISSRDISERKAYEQQLQLEQQRLERFASFVSHDLRNPLNVAQGRVELAREDCGSEHLAAAAESLDRMDDLIEDVLTLVRESEADLVVDAVALGTVAESCWDHVGASSATLTVESDRHLLADESKLQLLLENLLRNAVEHGGDGVAITVGALDDGFYVADDGPGIPEADRPSLFDYGFSTKPEGTGLGLSIVQEVVDRHGWTVTVTDSETGGARFEITDVEPVG